MTNQYTVGISVPDGPTMGWDEGGSTRIAAPDAEQAITRAIDWAAEGDYDSLPARVRLTAVNDAASTDRASRVVEISGLR